MKLLLGLLLFASLNSIAMGSPENAKLSRSTPVLKTPVTQGQMEPVCNSALKGTQVQILEKKNYFDVKIRILNGSCKNKVGWISSESVELS